MKKCLFCGRINDDDALFCCKCGRKIDEDEIKTHNQIADAILHYDEDLAVFKPKRLCCPKCKSNHLQAIVETSTSSKTTGNGYSPAKGCLGSLIFGSWGWFLGALGQQRTVIETKNRNYWICSDCGNKFRNTEDWNEEIKKKDQAVKVNLVLAIIFAVIALLFFSTNEMPVIISIVFLIVSLVNVVLFFFGKKRIQKEFQELERLKRASTE